MNKKAIATVLVVSAVAATLGHASVNEIRDNKNKLIERGKYIVSTSGCNDCHTPGYAEAGGAAPMTDWLTGSGVGFSGPWGVTYPANLRIKFQQLSEAEWMAQARSERRPPMPWFMLRDMTDNDLRAIYAFVHSLGASGAAAPNYVAPGGAVATPYIDFVPKMP